MQDRLRVTVQSNPGEVIRVLTLIERKRFAIQGLLVDDGDTPGTRLLDVSVTSAQRNVSSLVQQLRNLVDVVDVRLVENP